MRYDSGSPQYKFAMADLSSTHMKWKIVICHAPAYCAGGHGNDNNLIKMTREIFEPNNVDMVIAGHTHFYQHNLIHKIHHLIIGSAGAPLYAPGKSKNTIVSKKDYNWAIGEVSTEKLILTIYNAENKKLDRIELKK
jgi:predicted phosphodiesterase